MNPLIVSYSDAPPDTLEVGEMVIQRVSETVLNELREKVESGAVDRVYLVGIAACTGWNLKVARSVVFKSKEPERNDPAELQAMGRLLRVKLITPELPLLDDGDFFIEHNANYQMGRGNGFLLRRCRTSQTAPAGYECIGGYELSSTSGKWIADVHISPASDDDSDVMRVGEFDTQARAVAALWEHRQQAYCRHPRY